MSRPGSSRRRHNAKSNKSTKYHYMSGGGQAMSFSAAKRACLDKTRFHSRKTVRRAAKEFGLRYYRCKFCGEWHLTSSKGGIDPCQ